MSDPRAEAAVKKLARLPHNTICPNCGFQKKFGFSSVCIKFFTFVCNDCKSSHAAYSHRCKSLTMSSWTADEVAALERGGNEVARNTWLANAPPIGAGGRPKHGDSLPVFKQFIVDAYERKRYFGERRSTRSTTKQVSSSVSSPQPPASRQKQKVLRPPPKTSTAAPSRSSNFASFPPAAAPSKPAAVVPDLFAADTGSATTATTNKDAVFDPFGNQPTATSFQASFPAPTPKSEPTNQTPATTSGGAATSFQASFPEPTTNSEPTNQTPATTSGGAFGDFDPFGNSNSSTAATTNAASFSSNTLTETTMLPQDNNKQPVMSNNSGNSISAMGYFMPQQQQQGNKNNMASVGFNNNNNNMSFGRMNHNMGMAPQPQTNNSMLRQQQQQQMFMMQQQQRIMMMQQQQSNMNNGIMMQPNNNMMMMQPPVMSMGSSTGATISAMTPQTNNQDLNKKDPFDTLF